MSSRLTSIVKNNLVAVLALFVALGGTSYAAIKLPADSVGSKQLKKRSVTLSKVSLSARESLRGQTGPKGDKGDTGAKGDKGDIGPSVAFGVAENGIQAWNGAQQTVLSLSLPAGSFVIQAKVQANNNANAIASANCRLELGDAAVDAPANGLTLGANGQAGERAYIVLSGVASAAAPSAATVKCTAAGSGNWLNRAITATQVGAIG